MKTYIDCIPCFIKQVIETARLVTDNPKTHEYLVKEALALLGNCDMTQPPPVMAMQIYRMIHNVTGVKDPYYDYKRRTNRSLMEMSDRLKAAIDSSDDPLTAAVIASINGNMIDCGIDGGVSDEQIAEALHAPDEASFTGCVKTFQKLVDDAENILFLADNCGEIVLDKLLLEHLPLEKITLAVRGKPIINDVLMEDAQEVGLCDMLKVIDNGADAPGTVLAECSDEFRQAFDNADLVIAKGQGNYETLSEVDKNIVFLFKAKCHVICTDIGQTKGKLILQHKPGSK